MDVNANNNLTSHGGFQDIDDEFDQQEVNELLSYQSQSRSMELQSKREKRPLLNTAIREYVWDSETRRTNSNSSWLSRREIPTAEEINSIEKEIRIPKNNIIGPWESKEHYLETQYELLREDAISSLRTAVDLVRENPEMNDNEFLCIYQDAHIVGVTFTHLGIAARFRFSCVRAGKRIVWEQSKRLKAGTLLALTPSDDMFKNVCKVVTVAARPLQGLQQNPPEVDIFFACPEEIEIDPIQEWVMVEARNGYFEAYRYTLTALQKQYHERLPLSKHLVDVKQDVDAPTYVKEQPRFNLRTGFLDSSQDANLNSVDILRNWPDNIKTTLDDSQISALRRMLTKSLAIVQGPPGTGKTHISIIALRIILDNMAEGDPPIILTAQTNHALDQMLRYVAEFEPEFVRLGGRTQDQGHIKRRTLHEIKKSFSLPPIPGGLKIPCIKEMKKLQPKLTLFLDQLMNASSPIPSAVLRNLGFLTDEQYKSLEKGCEDWRRLTEEPHSTDSMTAWLGDQLIPVDHTYTPQAAGLEIEEEELEYEQLKELEIEKGIPEEDDFDLLKGDFIPFSDPMTGRPKPQNISQQTMSRAIHVPDMWAIPESYRGAIYRILQTKAIIKLAAGFRNEAKAYYRNCLNMKIGKWETDSNVLGQTKIIGLTTTGLSKYRPLISSLKPKVVLIEEAAEALESLVTVTCMDSVEQLILVGDHQQLRASVTDDELARSYYLDVSLFERLVANGVEYSTLMRQRRMVPEIRRLLTPIYSQIEDHPDVLKREPVPGMGGINSFFFHHQWPESNDDYMSKCNQQEAEMLIGLYEYLTHNGLGTEKITIMTFYNGQRKLILKLLRNHPQFRGEYFKVVTVDSYQGEENDVILLSLVRSNDYGNIGFVGVVNRVCVALSRAQRGFYIFGNGSKLTRYSELWGKVIAVMAGNPRRIGIRLPLTCSNHGRTVTVKEPRQWDGIHGGCDLACKETLPCGHLCGLNCHPFHHDIINCEVRCGRKLPCGHQCLEACYVQPCRCQCVVKTSYGPESFPLEQHLAIFNSTPGKYSHRSSFSQNPVYPEHSAAEGHQTMSEEMKAQQKILDDEMERALFDVGDISLSESVGPNLINCQENDESGKNGQWSDLFANNTGDTSSHVEQTSLLD